MSLVFMLRSKDCANKLKPGSIMWQESFEAVLPMLELVLSTDADLR